MNYYPHHIGDFDRATRHLTRIERSIYRDLLDVYYDTEAPLTLDQPALCRKIIARSQEEAEAVRAILVEFFHETPGGWYHDRCEEELETYRKNNTQKSIAGKASAAAKAARRQQAINGGSTAVDGRSTAVQRQSNGTSTNQEPRTNNQQPEPEPEREAPPAPPAKAKAEKATGTRLPADWKPTAEDIEYCKTERPDLRVSLVATNFYDYWIAKSGKDATKVNWSATWRSWVRKEDARNAGRPSGSAAAPLASQQQSTTDAAKRLLGFTDDDGDADGRTINAA
jgi:uncharacterized protein YdaU (DUF1376 family)